MLTYQNTVFEHEKELFIIPRNVDAIVADILQYYRAPEKLYKMSAQGQAKFKEFFGFERQIGKRTAILEQYMQ